MRVNDPANLYIFTVALFIVCQKKHRTVLKVRCFYLRRRIDPLSTRDKKIPKTFHKNQRLNIRNQYQEMLHSQTMESQKFEEPHNIIPHHIDETVQERQMKYQKIVQALDMIFYLIGKQRISYQETQKAATNSGTL